MSRKLKFKIALICTSISKYREVFQSPIKIKDIGLIEDSFSIQLKKMQFIFHFSILSGEKEYWPVLPTYLRGINLLIINNENNALNMDAIRKEVKKTALTPKHIIITKEHELPQILLKKAVLACLLRYNLIKPSQFKFWEEKIQI